MREDLIEALGAIADGMRDAGEHEDADILDRAAAALEAAREDAGMRRFADMLLGGLNDIQDALGFTDEDKLSANGSAEIVAEIAELREDAERYRWLRDAAPETWTEIGAIMSLPMIDAAIDQARGKGVAG